MELQQPSATWPIVSFHKGGAVPAKLLEWRRQTFVHERRYLTESDLTSENDAKGWHILVESADGKTVLGATHIMLAEESDFAAHSGIDARLLTNGVHSSRTFVHPDARHRGYFSLLFYLGMRWARMQGRTMYYGYIEEGEPPFRKMVGPDYLGGVPPRRVVGSDGSDYQVLAVCGSVDYAMHRCYRTLSKGLKEFVNASLMPEEIEHTILAGIENFYMNPWFQQVYAGTASRRQYAAVLANLHHYVRWTTRLLGRIIAETPCAELRGHYLEHLTGEVDHERMLEHDLEALGCDVEYLLEVSAPDPGIVNFMSIQQSLAAFERDPVLFLVVPLVAEGLSAFMAPEFLTALERCIASWGLERPRSAMTFLRSHVHTDGGERGHWQAVRNVLARRLDGERMMQRALAFATALLDAQRQTYTNIAKIVDLRQHQPQQAFAGLSSAFAAAELS
jgi:hypothetical protein